MLSLPFMTKLLKGVPVPPLEALRETAASKSGLWKDAYKNLYQEADDETRAFASTLYRNIRDGKDSPLEGVKFEAEGEVSETERFEILFLCAVRLIRTFVQLNATGPRWGGTRPVLQEIGDLGVDGFEVIEQAVEPHLVVMAGAILKECQGEKVPWVRSMYGWWAIRGMFQYQRVLDGRSMTLAGRIGDVAAKVEVYLDDQEAGIEEDLKALWFCERSQIYLYYYDVVSAKESLKEAAKFAKATFRMEGLMGKRTKFQEKEVAQLVIRGDVVIIEDSEENAVFLETFRRSKKVVDMPLNDDVRLERMNLGINDNNVMLPPLSSIQQILLLNEMHLLRKSHPPQDELLKEQILAYVNALLVDPKLWNVFVVALLCRSQAETGHIRTVERSMLQFENLRKAVTNELLPHFEVRHQFVYAVPMPFVWEIDEALAAVMVSLGHVKSALDLFLKLRHYERAIECYHLLELNTKAEELIRDQMKKCGETPKLLVYLGDATRDATYYEKAWEASGHKNFASRERMGSYWFKKQEYAKAVPFLQEAVKLNPLEVPVWTRLGYAALQTEQWELAIKAYVHANNVDDESFENWNNLAQAALKLGKKDQALRALKQATKCNYEEWKVWENVLVVALQCFDLEWAIMAYNRLLDIKGAFVDELSMSLLVKTVCDDAWDASNKDMSRQAKLALQKLLGRATAKVTTNGSLWQSYALFLYGVDKEENGPSEEKWYNIVQHQQKAVRCQIQDQNWEVLPELTQKTVESVGLLCNRTGKFIEYFPNNPSAADFKAQAEFLLKQTFNSLKRKNAETGENESYSSYLSVLKDASGDLSVELS